MPPVNPSSPPAGYEQRPSGIIVPTQLRADARSDLLSPTAWLQGWAGGARATAGQYVSPQSSMGLSTYYACIRVIAEDAASLPLHILERLPRGRRTVPDHPLWPILHYEFNRDMTAMGGREVLYHHALGWGNGYALILRDESMTHREGEIVGLYPLHPTWVRPVRDRATDELLYYIRQRGESWQPAWERETVVPAEDMIHIRGPSPDGLTGYSIAQVAAESLGLSLAAQQYGANFFGKGGIPSGILKHPHTLSPEAREVLRQSWQAREAQTVAVLEEGLSWEQITVPPEQAQFLETRVFQVLEICRWFRMPPHMVGHLADAKYANIEQQAIDYVTGTLLPWLVRGEQELTRKLLSETPYYVKHDIRGLLRGDQAARAELYRALFMVGALSPNDIRELEEFNPYEGGDTYFLQSQYAPVQAIIDGMVAQRRRRSSALNTQSSSVMSNGQQALSGEMDYDI